MSDPIACPDLETVKAACGFECAWPYTHITAAIVVWNDPERLMRLLEHIAPYFANIVVNVQTDEQDPTDDETFLAAEEISTIIVTSAVAGFGDASFGPDALRAVNTKWTMKIDADELPSIELLESLSYATWSAEHSFQEPLDALWIPFRSWVEGQEYEERHAHMRLFETRLGWPPLLHSTPPSKRSALWNAPGGHFRHERTLDEMMQDYLRYYQVGLANSGWTEHNRLMMRSACNGVAAVKGWAFVKSHEWWPAVLAAGYAGEDPE